MEYLQEGEQFCSTSEVDDEKFSMPNEDTIKKVIFSTHFVAFCKQSVKGSIMAIARVYSDEGKFLVKSRENVRDLLRNGNFVFENNIQYLNSCWLNYFNKSDAYLIDKIDLMMKYGEYLHESCLFNHIWDFSQMLLFYITARIDIEELKDLEFLSQYIDIIMDAILSYHIDNIMKRENYCNINCEEVYQFKSGEDFIKTFK